MLEIIAGPGSVIHGHHIYKAIWTPEIGEIFQCEQEGGDPEDSYTVSVIKDDTIDQRKQGKGLKVPCTYIP